MNCPQSNSRMRLRDYITEYVHPQPNKRSRRRQTLIQNLRKEPIHAKNVYLKWKVLVCIRTY